MHIDLETGMVQLPNGFAVDPSLTQQDFRAGEISGNARVRDHGTPPWVQFAFSGGEIEGKGLLTNIFFYDQMLISIDMTANLYPPASNDWSSYSLDVEAATKEFHERLLKTMLGKPMKLERLSLGHLTPRQATLGCPSFWTFPWGGVCSVHDFKSGGTVITVSYGNRHAKATKA